jgi:hypothetical protein
MTTKAPTSRRLTRYLAVPALALGLAIGSPAVANAVWDIGVYDRCTSRIPDHVPVDSTNDYYHECCLKSGGIWNDAIKGCVAPPVDSQGRNPLPNGAPTHVIEPLPLPGQGGPVINPGSGGVA